MDISLLLQGTLIGFSIAAPVGPIGLLCIQRTLTTGRWIGLLSGLGAATADAFYGCVAGFGLTVVAGLLIAQQFWLSLVGGGYLCYVGLKTALTPPSEQAATVTGSTAATAYLSTFFLTLTNPATILSFIAIFTGLGLVQAGRTFFAAGTLVGGVFLGSALWWLALSLGVSFLRQHITSRRLTWINRLAGGLIGGFGLLLLLRLLGG